MLHKRLRDGHAELHHKASGPRKGRRECRELGTSHPRTQTSNAAPWGGRSQWLREGGEKRDQTPSLQPRGIPWIQGRYAAAWPIN